MKSKLLIIEDNPDDAELAVQSLREAGEQFDYCHVTRLSDALWELESHPKGTYQKIYLDSSLPDLKNRHQDAFDILARFVARENIIVVSGSSDPAIATKIHEKGGQFITKTQALSSNNNDLASLIFGLQMDKNRSLERHRELTRLEIQIVHLERQVEHNRSEIEILLNHAREEDARVLEQINVLFTKVLQVESRQLELQRSLEELAEQQTDKSALRLKSFEVRWQLIVALAAALAAALLPKLVEMWLKK